MKNVISILGIIVIAAIIGLSFIACGNDDGKDDPCEHNGWEWKTTKGATLAEDGEEERVCEKCGEIEKEVIPSWTVLFNTTWNNSLTGGGQWLRITENAYQINVTQPANNNHPDKFDFTINSWAKTEADKTAHGLGANVVALKLIGSAQVTGTFTANTEFDVYVSTASNGNLRVYWTSTSAYSGQTFTRCVDWDL